VRRRDFISLLGGAVAWPVGGRAQAARRRISSLMNFDESDPDIRRRIAAFEQEITTLGWRIGIDLQMDYRWTGGDARRLRSLAAELERSKPAVVLVNGSPALSAVAQETHSTPIVFVNVADPVTSGFVASLAKPGGNITGFTNFEFAMGSKWLELLKEVSPGLSRVAVIMDPENASASGFAQIIDAAASLLAMQALVVDARSAADIAPAIEAFAQQARGGLVIMPGGFTTTNRERIIGLAVKHRLPAVYPFRFHAVDGGLMAYGADNLDLFRRAGNYVHRILRGERPADLPVQAPTKFEFVINLKTARALNLDVPPMLLARADEVIE
jgi:putative ABC transport system substrate-binding protein